MGDAAPAAGGGYLVAVALIVVGGVVLAAGGVADWLADPVRRSVGGVELTEVETTAGVAVAPLTVPLGVAAAVAGAVLVALRGRARRLLGALVLADGVAGVVAVGMGLWRARHLTGDLAAGPAVAALGAGAVAAGGMLAMRSRRRPRLANRFDLECSDADDEWSLASDPEEDGRA